MYGTDALLQQQEEQRLQMEEQARQQEEQRKRDEEKRQQQMAAMQQQQSQSGSPAAGGINPGMMQAGASIMSNYMASNGIGGGAGMGAGAGAGGAGAESMGAGAGGAGGASGASSMSSAWPYAIAIAAIAHHQWARHKGMHDNSDAIEGRALYKDSEYYQKKGNEKLSGLGDEWRLGSLGSSPVDLFHKSTWTEGAHLAARGGILGNALRKIF